jgi:hypothetical protein
LEELPVLGWNILFALIAVIGMLLSALTLPSVLAYEITGAVFAFLLVVSLLARVMRNRA